MLECSQSGAVSGSRRRLKGGDYLSAIVSCSQFGLARKMLIKTKIQPKRNFLIITRRYGAESIAVSVTILAAA